MFCYFGLPYLCAINASPLNVNTTPNALAKAYVILGLQPNATAEEVKQAYRNMAKKYHPDRVITEDAAIKKGAEEKFKQVQEAYELICKYQN